MNAIYWYPITCLIEGTVLSEGRGTDHAFAYIGHPLIANKHFQFTPTPRVGAQDPKLKGQICYGWDLSKKNPPSNQIDLEWLLEVYNSFPLKDSFFLTSKNKNNETTYYFNKLAGNSSLMSQIQSGVAAKKIRASWQKDLIAFKNTRRKYLLYKDFE
jgi:uncharacterized protein YbbC (DUF1343 family)